MIYNGVDTRHFDPAAWAEAGRARRIECGFAEDDLVIGLCAVMRPEKAHGDLLQAILEADKLGVRWKALLIGDGPLRKQIEQDVRRLGLERRVVITGYRKDVRADLAATDVVSLVSVTETFSIAALEAMAMARPMVMSDVGGAREQVEHGLTGWLFPAGNVGALARCLAEAADRARLARMGSAARERALADYSIATMIQRYEALISTEATMHGGSAPGDIPTAANMDRDTR
jgi:glycosyltransferase involved in cell wall biosynthesis